MSSWTCVQGWACPVVILLQVSTNTNTLYLAVLMVCCRLLSVLLQGDFTFAFLFCALCIEQGLKLIFHPLDGWPNSCIHVYRRRAIVLMNNLKSPKCPIREEWLSKQCCNHSEEESAAFKMENYEDHERRKNIWYNITRGTKAEYKTAYTSQLQLHVQSESRYWKQTFLLQKGASGWILKIPLMIWNIRYARE